MLGGPDRNVNVACLIRYGYYSVVLGLELDFLQIVFVFHYWVSVRFSHWSLAVRSCVCPVGVVFVLCSLVGLALGLDCSKRTELEAKLARLIVKSPGFL